MKNENFELFKNCLLCSICIKKGLLKFSKDNDKNDYYLPTPWQGEIGDNIKVVFLSINPSPTVSKEFNSSNENLFSQVEKGYSVKASEFFKLSETEQNKILEKIYETLGNANNRMMLEKKIIGRKSQLWTYVKKISGCLINKNEKIYNAYYDYILTEIVHCQSKNVSELEGNIYNIGYNCFMEHTRKIIEKLKNVKWFVISGNTTYDIFLNKNLKTFFIDLYKSAPDSFNEKNRIYLNEKIFYVKLNQQINFLFLPFLGQGHWKNEYLYLLKGIK